MENGKFLGKVSVNGMNRLLSFIILVVVSAIVFFTAHINERSFIRQSLLYLSEHLGIESALTSQDVLWSMSESKSFQERTVYMLVKKSTLNSRINESQFENLPMNIKPLGNRILKHILKEVPTGVKSGSFQKEIDGIFYPVFYSIHIMPSGNYLIEMSL